MREVNYISSVNVEKRMLFPGEMITHTTSTANITRVLQVHRDEFMETGDMEVKHHIVPVTAIFKTKDQEEPLKPGERPDVEELFVAYSPEVQDLMQFPFDVIKRELQEATVKLQDQYYLNAIIEQSLLDYDRAPWRKRLRYLFTGKLL